MKSFVSVDKLLSLIVILKDETTDFDTWGTKVTLQDVIECYENKTFEKYPFSDTPYEVDQNYNHAARIAYLIDHSDDEPIELDVGCPSLGYHSVILYDGNHRLVAKKLQGKETIEVKWSGEEDYFNHLFVKPDSQYAY